MMQKFVVQLFNQRTFEVIDDCVDGEVFDSEEEARQGFIDYKQDYIRNVANKCKGKVPNKTYEAMLKWNVEIDD